MRRFSGLPFESLKRFIEPPLFSDQEAAAGIRQPFGVLVSLGFVISMIHAVIGLIIMPQYADRLIYLLAAAVVTGVSFLASYFKRVRLANLIFLVGMFILITLISAAAGGTRSPHFGIFTLFIMVAALLSGWVAAAVVAAASVVMGLIMVILSQSEVIPDPIATPLTAWLTHVTIMVIFTVSVYVISRRNRESLRRAQHELRERERVEAALRASEERMRVITDNLHDMVAYIDAVGFVRYASPSFLSGLGYESNEVIGAFGGKFIHPDDAPHLRALVADGVVDANQHPYVTFRCLHSDGHSVWVEASGSRVENQQGQSEGRVIVLRDVSERHELEALRLEQEKLRIALEKERELSELRNRMMIRISHEFRTPLTVIQTSSHFLDHYLDRLTDEQRHDRTRVIREEIQHITTMLNAISDVVNNRLLPRELTFTSVSLEGVCKEVIAQLEKTAIPRHIYELNAAASLFICADQRVLQAALKAILLNAAQYSPEGSTIQIGLSIQDTSALVQVMDQGIGIPANEQERIFEPFFRGTNINESRGLGFGLTIARTGVDAHQGTISVNSTQNVGTTVSLVLPLQQNVAPAEEAKSSPIR